MVQINISNTIKIKGLSKEAYSALKDRLTYDNPKYLEALKYSRNQYMVRKMPKTIKAYSIENGWLVLPRGFYIELRAWLDSNKVNYKIIDHTPKLLRVDSVPNITLRGYQEEMAQDLECFYGYSCLAQGAPAAGKTYLGLEFARRQGYRVLWLVHNDRLFNQAIKSACTIFNILEEDVGIIRGKKLNIGDFITVGMFQTLISKDIKSLGISDLFGIIIIDEVHHSPANTWRKVITQFNSKLNVGLTATPRRNDGLTQMLFDCMGPIITSANKALMIEEGYLVKVIYQTLNTGFPVDGANFKQIETNLVEIEDRNKLILELITKEYLESEHNYVVTLTSRRKHVELIHNLCLSFKIPALKMMGGQVSKKEKARIEQELNSKRCRVLISTFPYISEGFDYPPLNRIIYATPFRDDVRLEQSVGRGQRTAENKNESKIFDLIDDNSMLYSQSVSRLEYAKILELEIQQLQ